MEENIVDVPKRRPCRGMCSCVGGWFDCLLKRRSATKISVINLHGIISANASCLKGGLALTRLDKELEKAFKVKDVALVALSINCPGGSPVQTELLYERIRYLSQKHDVPVYSFVEDVAASGGYWLACAADKIFASRSSVVGSIGVISHSFGFYRAIDKLGIDRRIYTEGKNKSVLDPFSPEKTEDINMLKNVQRDIYDHFKDIVSARREGKLTEDVDLFDGSFWSGTTALSLGLIDEIGIFYTEMVKKFGDNLAITTFGKEKGWLKRKLNIAIDEIVSGVLSHIYESSLWQRFTSY